MRYYEDLMIRIRSIYDRHGIAVWRQTDGKGPGGHSRWTTDRQKGPGYISGAAHSPTLRGSMRSLLSSRQDWAWCGLSKASLEHWVICLLGRYLEKKNNRVDFLGLLPVPAWYSAIDPKIIIKMKRMTTSAIEKGIGVIGEICRIGLIFARMDKESGWDSRWLKKESG